jgi:hypothetical protein
VLIDRSTIVGLAEQLGERLAWSAVAGDEVEGIDEDVEEFAI